MDRRSFLASGAALTAFGSQARAQGKPKDWVLPEEHKPRYVRLKGGYPAGEIHVDPATFSLYWTVEDGRAIRYTVGIGRGDLYERGTFNIGAKKEWPSWTPTQEMIERNPGAYKRFEDGMPGGAGNPLGARALYLFTPERGDTFLRIHGTPRPWTIASAVSNGCVRLTNGHVAHLYDQVGLGAKVVLH
jgi:lipoprotein-anchoring transpeptidase ErfK/SrfK